jgi:general stress protein 26
VTQERPRSGPERQAHALERLRTHHADVWVATAAEGGQAHLVPLSLAWDDGRIVLVTPPDSVTARNLMRAGQARLALDGSRDVVMVDAALEVANDLEAAPDEVLAAYAAQADWDPRSSTSPLVVLALRPTRMQVWREADEIAGRTVMRDGRWLF